MKHSTVLVLGLVLALPGVAASGEECSGLLRYSLQPLRGQGPVDFCAAYRGKVILAVNTASRCGYTPQFKGLEALYQKFRDRGFIVLGFPSDDFRQEYQQPEKTAEVCYINYGVSFPMFTKIAVSGERANPFFKALAAGSGQEPGWNFFKYLIDRHGVVQTAYASAVTPEDPALQQRIEALLTAPQVPPSR